MNQKIISLVRFCLIILIVFQLNGNSTAKNIDDDLPQKPAIQQLVNDFANILTERQKSDLEDTLDDFDKSSSCQIAIITINDLHGHAISEYAFSIGEKWGIGKKGENNGILIVIKPKAMNQYGETFIAVGYGLEEVVTDYASKLIVDREMIPRFKENDYYGGILNAVVVLKDLCNHKYSSSDYINDDQNDNMILALLIIIVIITIIAVIYRKRNKGNEHVTVGGKRIPWWILLFFTNDNNKKDKDIFGNGRGGGSFGSRGFGGFGGGSFGGGGAGGRW